MFWKRFLSVILVFFFIMIAVATSKQRTPEDQVQMDMWREIRLLEERRDALKARIDEMENRCTKMEENFSPIQEEENHE